MADAATISSLATAGGTLVLAVATFAAVRSSNRSARLAEIALQEQRRPLLVQSRLDDPRQKIMFGDQHWVSVEGSHGMVEHVDGNVYLVMSLRNAGAGIGVCQGWSVRPGLQRAVAEHVPEEQFRAQMRDLYISGGDVGLWQGARCATRTSQAMRRSPTLCADASRLRWSSCTQTRWAASGRSARFSLIPFAREEDDQVSWIVSGTRHWYLDRVGPR